MSAGQLAAKEASKAAQREKEAAAHAKKEARKDAMWAVGAKDTSSQQAAAQKAAEMAAKKAEANKQLEAELNEGSNKGLNKKKKPEDPNAIKKVSKSDAKDKLAKAKLAMEKAAKKNGVELARCKTMADALQAALDVRPTRYAAKSQPNGSWPSKFPRKKKSGGE